MLADEVDVAVVVAVGVPKSSFTSDDAGAATTKMKINIQF